ncbi:E3 ubiquitin-protein ligase PUB24 [Vitis vinifera]|uniref:U-box domain-containing protein n=1 Tax=Vitis vinifera TaxID=29760 RepID=A0A438D8G7_VITVI|nr:E3 ubiquitin-protein ligase PUB24 [Vitis vinifera]RVW83537.1 E3 ubiquitin-protein ligase PUB24 [Vitis vinifera]
MAVWSSMDDIEIPQYFLCPISLQIMKDPVTAMTGITYDRESIEQWLLTAKDTTCPVTKQPLERDFVLTPNHTLRRLIQAWCAANATNGVDQIPTPKTPLDRTHVVKLIRDLGVAQLYLKTLQKMEALTRDNERNRNCMADAGAAKAIVLLIIKCFKENKTTGVEEGLRILHLIWSPTSEMKLLLKENYDFVDAVTWALGCETDNYVAVRSNAVLVLKNIVEVASPNLLERLKFEFLNRLIRTMREKISQAAMKAALYVLMEVCPWGRNKWQMIEAGAVFQLIEMELENPEKKITEIIFCLLGHLCSCADGRAQFLAHAGSMAMLSKRILRVSNTTDDRALHIIALISKFSGTNEVLMEMLRVGAVSKLCMVLQADCAKYLKEKAREILRLHSKVWNNSPCIAVYLLTRYAR